MTHSLHPPKVSLGLPVCNGEDYLAEAIESVLAQDFTDFELIITDNASTDRTAEICQTYASKDARIRVHRHAKNLGAAPNFNSAFELSKGEYFKWVAHDDLITPDYLMKCVAVLDRNPEIVLCHSLVDVIDETGALLGTYDSGISGTEPSEVFGKIVLRAHWCTDIFGLIRASVLRQIRLFDSFHGADEIVLAELAMFGGFANIDEPLFSNREHSGRYSVQVAIQDQTGWYNSEKQKKRGFPLWRQYSGYFATLRRYPIDPAQRRRGYVSLAKWWFVNWNAIRMVVDVIAAFEPRVFLLAAYIKHRIFGSAAPMLPRGPKKSHG